MIPIPEWKARLFRIWHRLGCLVGLHTWMPTGKQLFCPYCNRLKEGK